MRKPYRLQWGNFDLVLGKQTLVMGIVNVTPDSFSDGGKYFSADAAIAQAETLAEQGADIIDIGGESTRPFSDPVSVSEELNRTIPVIETLTRRLKLPISIDTTKAEVARQALSAGAAMINDVGALRIDPELATVAAEFDVPIVLMHMLGLPKDMQVAPVYTDLINDLKSFLEDAIRRAVAYGIQRDRILIDPGIGFGKTYDHNLQIIQQLSAFQSLDAPIMVGSSRKAFIRHLLKNEGDDDLQADLPVVETGTQATVSAAVLNGAHLVRVHDVASTKATLTIIDAIANAAG